MDCVVSVSGGRSSLLMAYLVKEKYSHLYENIYYVFANTGVEHPDTYRFLLGGSSALGINIISIRSVVTMESGVGTGWMNTPLAPDREIFADMVYKYGRPNTTRRHCTRVLKAEAIRAWCRDNIKSEYVTALGIRSDEPKRLTRQDNHKFIYPLADTDMDRDDVEDFCKPFSWDLTIPKQLGNCTFCWQKSSVALGKANTEYPQCGEDSIYMDEIDVVGTLPMYRGYKTFYAFIADSDAPSRKVCATEECQPFE